MNKIGKILISLAAVLFVVVVTARSAHAQPPTVGDVQQSIEQGVNDVVGSFNVSKLTETPQRDLMTLAVGGLLGFAAGGFLTNLGILNVQVFGLAVIPLIGGVSGIYLANEGYFDGARDLIGGAPAPKTP